jgi:hypothetical protein
LPALSRAALSRAALNRASLSRAALSQAVLSQACVETARIFNRLDWPGKIYLPVEFNLELGRSVFVDRAFKAAFFAACDIFALVGAFFVQLLGHRIGANFIVNNVQGYILILDRAVSPKSFNQSLHQLSR